MIAFDGRGPSRAASQRVLQSPRAPLVARRDFSTTLRVPDDLAATVERYAEQHRTSTTNDALIRLAYDGARIYDDTREIEELARVRGEAIMRLEKLEVPPGTEPATDEEVTDAILAWRRGLDEEDDSDEDDDV